MDENSQRVDYDNGYYDFVMISFETSSALSAYRRCDAFRKQDSYIVCGGYHATALPEETTEHCDTVIIDPAEISIPEFIRDVAAGEPNPRYRNFDVCAAEFLILTRDKITKRKKRKIPAILANRSWGNVCEYRSMRTMWKSDPRPIESVV